MKKMRVYLLLTLRERLHELIKYTFIRGSNFGFRLARIKSLDFSAKARLL